MAMQVENLKKKEISAKKNETSTSQLTSAINQGTKQFEPVVGYWPVNYPFFTGEGEKLQTQSK